MKYDTLILDCDGVLTDGTHWQHADGSKSLRFSRIDGHGIAGLRATGVHIMVVTASDDEAISIRCDELRIACHLGVRDKLKYVHALGVDMSRAVMVGDDDNDLGLLSACAVAATPKESYLDAHCDGVLSLHRLSHRGGEGAVREMCDIIFRENIRDDD